MQSRCGLDAVWMRSGCGLDAVWMRPGCGLDANKIFKDKSKCGFRHEETKLLRLPLNFPGELFAFIFFFWRYDDKYLLLFVFCGFGVDGIVRRANLFIYFTVKVLS